MKKTVIAALAVAVMASALFSQQAQAVPITGKIDFFGNLSTNTGNLNNATAFTSFTGVQVVNNPPFTPTGSYAGSGGTGVTMNGFSFIPFVAPVPNLWSFVFGGRTYTFNLTAVTSVVRPGNDTLTLTGNGIAMISGVGPTFDATPGTFSISTQGPAAGSFSFSATTTSAPEGGSALALLGIGLVAVEVLRRKLAAA